VSVPAYLHYLEPKDAQQTGCKADDDIDGMKEGEMKELAE
jgi:hypothetical protein